MKSFPLIVRRLLRSVRTSDQTIEYRWHGGRFTVAGYLPPGRYQLADDKPGCGERIRVRIKFIHIAQILNGASN